MKQIETRPGRGRCIRRHRSARARGRSPRCFQQKWEGTYEPPARAFDPGYVEELV